MKKNDNFPTIFIMVIIAIALYGGSKNISNNGLVSQYATPEEKQADIQKQINIAQKKVDDLKQKISEEEANQNASIYKGKVNIFFINRSPVASQEYVTIHASGLATTSIPVTGWTIKSLSSGASVKIPQASYLYFAGTLNGEQDIYLSANDTLYLNTGISPNGASFKINKCSGYLNQFQTFVPYIGSYCPAPRNEDVSKIPRTGYNDSCFDYIETMPSCRIQNDPLPSWSQKWSVECTDFIYKKINYPACVDTHKNDKDFYQPEWRVYLKRSEPLWKNNREYIVLLDQYGKIVDEIKY